MYALEAACAWRDPGIIIEKGQERVVVARAVGVLAPSTVDVTQNPLRRMLSHMLYAHC